MEIDRIHRLRDRSFQRLPPEEQLEMLAALTHTARVLDDDFTHLITVNFARNVRFLPTASNEALVLTPTQITQNYLSHLAIEIQSICLNISTNQVKKLRDKMLFDCAIEDHKKYTSIPEARHFNISVKMPELDNKMNQLRVKAAANRLAEKLFKTQTTNCHIEGIPTEAADRERRIVYNYKNCHRDDSINIITERDFRSTSKQEISSACHT